MAKKTRRVSYEERIQKTNVMTRAWEIARAFKKQLSNIQGMPKNTRDYLKVATKRAWGEEKLSAVILDPSEFPIVVYEQGMGNGGDPISIFVESTHTDSDGGSGTFWLVNRGKGRGGDDDLDPSVYLTDWDNGSDYSVDEAMTALAEANHFGDQYMYDNNTHRVVLKDKFYETSIRLRGSGYDPYTLFNDDKITLDEILILRNK